MKHKCISSREKEILDLIAYEKSTKMIARELYISEHTVVSHRKNLMAKLNVSNTAGLVRRAFETGLLSLSRQVALFLVLMIGGLSVTAQTDMTVEGLDAEINIDNFGVAVGQGAKLNFKFNGDRKFTMMNPIGSNLLFLNTDIGDNRVFWDEYGNQTNGHVAPFSGTHTLTLGPPTSNGSNSLVNSGATGNSSLIISDKTGRTSRIQFVTEESNNYHQLQSSPGVGLFWMAYYDSNITPATISRPFAFDTENARFGIGSGVSNTNPDKTLDVKHEPVSNATSVWSDHQGFSFSNTNNGDEKEWLFYTRGDELNSSVGDLLILSGHLPNGGNHLRASIDYEDGTYSSFSDKRFKSDIEYLDRSVSLEKLLLLKPATYKIKGQESTQKSYGMIAQDVQSVLPTIVTSMATSDTQDYLGLTYDEFIPVIISAVQKQNEIISNISEENRILKAQLEQIKSNLAVLVSNANNLQTGE